MKKKIGCLLAAVLLLTGCGKIPTLEDGKEAVVTFENGDKISVDELYDKMKNTYALQTLVTMVDTKVLNDAFKDYMKEANSTADNYIDTLKSNYESEEELVNLIQSYYGISSIEAYKEYIYLSYMQSHATEEYAKTLVTDKEIKNYYDKDYVADIEVSHILITPTVTDKMTDEEIKNADSTAKEKAESLLKELKDTKAANLKDKFAELAKANSEDKSSSDNGGSIGKINKIGDNYLGGQYDELTNAAYKTKDGAVYGSVVKTELGYHIVYRTATSEKEELDKVKDMITTTLSEKKMEDDETLPAKALQYYRKQAGMEIQDSELQTQYAYYMQNSL